MWRLQWDSYSNLPSLIHQPAAQASIESMLLAGDPHSGTNLGLTDEARNDVPQIIEALQHYVDCHV